MPAWVGVDSVDDLAVAVRTRPCAELVAQAELLGLAVSSLGEWDSHGRPAIVLRAVVTPAAGYALRRQCSVLDLSALWAGPLAAHLLARRRREVTKVESMQRPDDLKLGRPDLYAELNSNKTIVTFDWHDTDGASAR